MKRLYICRHAKSSWKLQDISDFDRPLNHRGKKDAPFMGKLLAKQKIKPDLIFSSPAKRAITTAKTVASEIGYPIQKIKQENNIYDARLGYLIDFVQALPDKLNTVMIFGHNPGVTSLNNIFSKQYINNLPTSGIVELEFDSDKWSEIDLQTGELINYEFPKKYENQIDEELNG